MIIGVDIGGTKTLMATFTESGKLLNEVRFDTSPNYETFLDDLKIHANKLESSKCKIACISVPGRIDRKSGAAYSFGNLQWRDIPILSDMKKALNVRNVVIENDSKLGGLAEVKQISTEYKRVFYITISTGIGGALLVNGKLSEQMIDSEVGKVPMLHKNKVLAWEEFASGKAFYKKYDTKAVDVNDPAIWKEFSDYIGLGVSMICATFQVDAIIFGGGLGQYIDKFRDFIEPYTSRQYLHDNIVLPQKLFTPKLAEESVIYGCYYYAKAKLTKH
ncbi:ROK family protein [Candidatus Saccharibacteria bacterium]|jgi:glucokinase|nr:ROK family protein [Candidatus Saccharibacteria bacterium]